MNSDRTILVDGSCMESYPCQHDCIINGELPACRLSGRTIANEWWDQLDNENRRHFEGYRETILVDGSCMESWPCQHDCIIDLGKPFEKECTLNGKTIALKWWDQLDERNRNHFEVYR